MVLPRRPSRLGERGQALEYSLILVLIAVGLVAVLGLIGKTTRKVYAESASAVKLPESYSPAGGFQVTPPSSSVAVTPASSDAPSDSTASDSTASDSTASDSSDALSGPTYSHR